MQGDDDQIYALTFQFDYDTLADKKKIDDYLDGLEFKNASYFTVGNLKIGENLVK
ncbi:MAG: hypothetical protein H6767_09670 [Candidatus Peribacteria bacterium]|nr:MAG: hypothetical protein H6767_09670 [Candidatus Peribacteria bacterium]